MRLIVRRLGGAGGMPVASRYRSGWAAVVGRGCEAAAGWLRDGCGMVVAGVLRGCGVGHGVTMARNRLCISDITKPRAVFGEHAHK